MEGLVLHNAVSGKIVNTPNRFLSIYMRPFRRALALLVAACIFAGLLSACEKKKAQDGEDRRGNLAMKRIDENDPDAAIAMLKNRAQTTRLKMILASAYAARAGIKVETFWGYTVGYENFVETTAGTRGANVFNTKNPEASADDGENANSELLSRINQISVDLQRVRLRFDEIPYMEYERRDDLYRALEVLQDTPTKGAKLYRAILGMILIKSVLQDAAHLAARVDMSHIACDDNLPKVVEWLLHGFDLTLNFLNDLNRSFPNKAAEFKGAIAKFRDSKRVLRQKSDDLLRLRRGARSSCK